MSASGREELAYEQAARYAADLRELYERDRARAQEVRARREVAARIAEVIERDAVSVVYQPIFDLRDDGLMGLEALSRFQTEPHRPPDVWFREAEAVDLAVELELLAVRRAVSRFDALPGSSYLAINLSPATAMSDGFADIAAELPAERLVMEVTEHAPVDDYAHLSTRLKAFRSAGGRLAVDDAGAGFASLRHILALAPDIIKVDISLTRDVDTDRARRALASALITFAVEIGATIVAEGIETRPELDTLRDLGAACGQGYFLARPAPLEQLDI